MAVLDGVRILDLSTGVAGAYATKMFADAGADVLKIEPPGGDPLRRYQASSILGLAPPLQRGEDGPLFKFLHASKRSAVLDLADGAGRRDFLSLVAGADLVFESFEPGYLASLGLAADSLRAVRPGVSLVSITPWGQTGPWAGRAATEFTLQAETGSTAYRGYDDRLPVSAGGRIGDFVCASFAAVGAFAALLSARSGGRGFHVDVAQFEAMLISFQTFNFIHSQFQPGTRLPRTVEIPSVEPAADGWVGFCTITAQQWKDFCFVIDQPELGEETELHAAQLRFRFADRIWGIIHEWTRAHTIDEAIEKASLMRVPVAPIGDGRTVLEMDQFVEREVFEKNADGFPQPRVPYRLGRGETRPFGPVPRLGEHTEEALAEAEAARDSAATGAPAVGTTGASGSNQSAERPAPMSGLKVADFTAFWAGPVAASMFSALGADVIKIESIQRPDGMRFAGGIAPQEGQDLWEICPVFHGANPGKRGITLDLESEEGLALAKRIVAEADIVIENFSPRVIERFGLGWEEVRALNPEAIMVRMPAFGLAGPWRDRTGFAMTIEQATGLAYRTGFPDRSPLVPRGSCDPYGGMGATFATLLALEVRAAGGGGQLVEVPLVEAGLNAAAEQVAEYTRNGVLLERMANRGPFATPQGVYACAGEDENIAIAVESDEQWHALVGQLGSPDWAADASLASAEGRRAAEDDIDARIAEWCAGLNAADTVEQLVAAGVPAGLLRNAREIRPHPHLEETGFFQTFEHKAGTVGYPSFPLRFDGEYLAFKGPAHTLGQHNDEVLTGVLGLTTEEIAELREKKIAGERPSFM